MKYLIILFSLFTLNLNAQSYIGFEVGKENYGVTLNQEIDTSFFILSLKTTIASESTFKARIGFKIGKPDLHVALFIIPIYNLNLTNLKYNTPFNFELRYNPQIEVLKGIRVLLGVELYKNGNHPYINIIVPFK